MAAQTQHIAGRLREEFNHDGIAMRGVGKRRHSRGFNCGEVGHGEFQCKSKPKSAALAMSGREHAIWRDQSMNSGHGRKAASD